MFYYKMAVHDACVFTGDINVGADLGAAMTGPVSEAYVGGGG